MTVKRTLLSSISMIAALNLFCHTSLHAITNLQQNDPDPLYSANDSMVPPNSHFLDLNHAVFTHEMPNKKKALEFNLTGFIQGASTAYGYAGCTEYGTTCGQTQNGFELGDFRGTMYALGLFLGANPSNGQTIWTCGTAPCTGGIDTGITSDITLASIEAFGLPSCLQTIALNLTGLSTELSPVPAALIFNNSVVATNFPSIFHADALARDTIYFGAFSMPIEYKKQGARFEINVACGNHIGITIQTGAANIQQKFLTAYSQAAIGQTNMGPYSITSAPTTSGTAVPLSPLYTNLNFTASTSGVPNTAAQALFDTNISNNLPAILDPVCGHHQGVSSFDDYSIEDVNLYITLQKTFSPNGRSTHGKEYFWPDMMFTPYIYAAGTFPTAKEINYHNILSMPFGNNGHAAVGGAVGMTFDFVESVEIGFESGGTFFFPKDEYRPFPTHRLQRVLYPFSTDVRTKPGANFHFKALLSAYQFMPHINFWFTYEVIEHRKDYYEIIDASVAQYFVPESLTNKSDWRSQFFNAGLSFDIHPCIEASIVWQQPIVVRNAYYPVSVAGSINFIF